ncbi:MAG: hypothetical protein JXX29_13170 [Deltaproteobacteria bacterium]|nr:hypothetical protein [Deltaproteobacteria bacterium]MBN2672629.1 hypothetical protein [Deltaproteobacteria bacterium]
MKKVTLLFRNETETDAHSIVSELRDFGAFHFGLSDESTTKLEQMEEALTILQQRKNPQAQEFGSREKNAAYYTSKILHLTSELNSTRAKLAQLSDVAHWYKVWSEVSIRAIEAVAGTGLHIKLFEMATGDFRHFNPASVKNLFVVGSDTKVIRLALVTPDKEAALENTQEVSVPGIDVSELHEAKSELLEKEKQYEDELHKLSGRMHIISKELQEEKYRIQFNQVKSHLKNVDGLSNVSYIEGYIPADTVSAFKKMVEHCGWGFSMDDPSEEDHPPTLLRNPKFVEPVYMLYKFLGMRIGYRELDVSFMFILFYTIITGLLVGDAGYGLIYFGLTAFAHAKLKGKADSRYFQLGYVLSSSIIVFGALSGVWFGSVTLAGLPGLRDITIPELAAFDLTTGKMSNSIQIMMQIGFALGIIHLSIGHLMKGWQQRKNLEVIGHLAYIVFLFCVYKVICFLIFKEPLPDYLVPGLAGSIPLMFIFSNASQGLVAGMKSQAATFVFDLIGGFSDLISYIRIPIVGLVTVVLGMLFNLLSVGAPLGHAFGLILAVMGVLIHATRLKAMEFSNHAGMEWNGEWYKPFIGKEKKQWI